MGFLRTTLLLLCIGTGSLACRTAKVCVDMETSAKEKESDSDPAGYCVLQSRAIACLSADGCSDSVINDLKAAYYRKCFLTNQEVTQCAATTTQLCGELRTAAKLLESTDLSNYCGEMGSYQSCLSEVLVSICRPTPRVTVYDVMGADFGDYEITCRNVTFIECQAAVTTANCGFYVKSSPEEDLNAYCSELTTFRTCINTTFARCDQSLALSHFYKPHDTNYLLYCDERTRQCQAAVGMNCSSIVTDGQTDPTQLCSELSQYISCVERTMETCDPSVREDIIFGPLRANYVLQCGPDDGDSGSCPAVATCMAQMEPEEGNQGNQGQQSDGTPNIIGECGNIGEVMQCFDTEFTNCGRPSPRSYTFRDVSQLYTTSCQAIASSSDLMSDSCSAMMSCMVNLQLPSDPVQLAELYYDPEFWCRLLKMTVNCGVNVKDSCQVDLSVLNSLLANIDSLCYPGGVTDGVTDGITDGKTPDGVTDGITRVPVVTTTDPISAGFKTHAGVMSYLSLVLTLLVQTVRSLETLIS